MPIRARVAIATILLFGGGFSMLGDDFGARVPAVNAIKSMTAEAPFRVAPQPTASPDAPSPAVRSEGGAPPWIAAAIGLIALVAIALGVRSARRGRAAP